MKSSKGITLIALVMTIIVLLILSGVSISLTLGNNGVLNQATKAVILNKKAKEKEQLQIEAAGSYDNDITLKADILIRNINDHIPEVEEIKGVKFPLIVKYNSGNKYKINSDSTVEELLPNEITIGERAPDDKNAIYRDGKYRAIIPAGFSVSDVEGEYYIETGLVIKDDNNNEFVWIPVGINKKSEPTEKIELARYTFNNDGSIKEKYSEQSDTIQVAGYNCGDTKTEFIQKINQIGGYYIGRYEARTTVERNIENAAATTAVTENKNDYVYRNINKVDALAKSKEMYATNDNFEVNLISGFAWDTALLFLQEYDDRDKNNINNVAYSMQHNLATEYCDKGTDVDKICNVYDMASNEQEWTTESVQYYGTPHISRGGDWGYGVRIGSCKASVRISGNGIGYRVNSFRPVIYIKK